MISNTSTYKFKVNGYENKEALIKTENLKKYFPINNYFLSYSTDFVRAVDDINLSIFPGETYGLVGESGSGKSTLGKTILRLFEATDGIVYFQGTNITSLKDEKLRSLRRKMQIIFQDPYGSLNPRMTVGETIGEALRVHGIAQGEKQRELVEHTLELCGMEPYHYNRYPHEFSGGQRQRIVIARALILQPVFIVADEPVSSLDVSIQSQIINLLKELQNKLGLTYLFISHDLSVVKHIANRIGVMYLGVVVEEAPKKKFFQKTKHPYTKALLSAIPLFEPSLRKERIILKGEIPSSVNPPTGCRFHTRCPHTIDACKKVEPKLKEVSPRHLVACHLVNK